MPCRSFAYPGIRLHPLTGSCFNQCTCYKSSWNVHIVRSLFAFLLGRELLSLASQTRYLRNHVYARVYLFVLSSSDTEISDTIAYSSQFYPFNLEVIGRPGNTRNYIFRYIHVYCETPKLRVIHCSLKLNVLMFMVEDNFNCRIIHEEYLFLIRHLQFRF